MSIFKYNRVIYLKIFKLSNCLETLYTDNLIPCSIYPMKNLLIRQKLLRMKLRFLQHVNKTVCHTKQSVQQGKCPPIFKIFLITCVFLFTFRILLGYWVKKYINYWLRNIVIAYSYPLLLHQIARDQIRLPIRGNWFVAWS